VTKEGATLNSGGATVTTLSQTRGTTTMTAGSLANALPLAGGTFTLNGLKGAIPTIIDVTVTNDAELVVQNGTAGNVVSNATVGGATNVTVSGGTVASVETNSGETVLSGGTITNAVTNGGQANAATTTVSGAVTAGSATNENNGTFTIQGRGT